MGNAPWAVHAILKVLWPMLPKRIAEKIQVIPVVQTAERMCERVNPPSLPHFLGGDVPDDDFVPSRAVILAALSGEIDDGGVEIVVAAGKKHERALWLNKDDTAGYGFSVTGTSNLDIIFGCRFEAENPAKLQSKQCNEEEPVAAAQNCIPANVEVRAPVRIKQASGGSFVAPARGRLIMTFDNSYSWVNSKTVRYECVQIAQQTASGNDTDQQDA